MDKAWCWALRSQGSHQIHTAKPTCLTVASGWLDSLPQETCGKEGWILVSCRVLHQLGDLRQAVALTLKWGLTGVPALCL